MKHRLITAYLFFLLLMLSGCTGAQVKTYIPRLVTRIDVTSCQDSVVRTQSFTEPENMSLVLNYLRQLNAYITVAIEPDTFRADAFRITVHFSDGTQRIYHQLYDQYLQCGDSDWQKIDPELGCKLPDILSSISQYDRLYAYQYDRLYAYTLAFSEIVAYNG